MGGRTFERGKAFRWSCEGGGRVEDGKSWRWRGGYWDELSICYEGFEEEVNLWPSSRYPSQRRPRSGLPIPSLSPARVPIGTPFRPVMASHQAFPARFMAPRPAFFAEAPS